METIELRCPNGHKRLFAKVLRQGPPHITEDNLMEFACSDCTRRMTKQGYQGVTRVLHRYNLLGELVESVTE